MIYKRQNGFTIFEILIAVMIVAVMGAIIGPRFVNYLKRAKVTATKQAMENIKSALLLYNSDKGKYPTSREGLEVLVGEYLESEKGLKDGWGNDFEYNSPPLKYKNKYRYYEIISYGEGGLEGGEELESDLHVGY